jgi:hypothetical protein
MAKSSDLSLFWRTRKTTKIRTRVRTRTSTKTRRRMRTTRGGGKEDEIDDEE